MADALVARPVFPASRALFAAEPDDFRRAAADIEQHDAFGGGIGQRGAAGGGKPGLGLAGDDFELQAGLLANPGDEFRAVFGGAAGFGGDQPGAA